MSDTQRTRAAILTIFADNVTGQISEQDLRDFIVTIMEQEFANPGDFWNKPKAEFTTTDKTARGTKMYSQEFGEAVSFMNVIFLDNSEGNWHKADAVSASQYGIIGLAMDSYGALASGTILLEGMVFDSSFSTVFSRLLGQTVFLNSGTAGSITTTPPTDTYNELALGFVAWSTAGDSAVGKWYFKPNWGVNFQT